MPRFHLHGHDLLRGESDVRQGRPGQLRRRGIVRTRRQEGWSRRLPSPGLPRRGRIQEEEMKLSAEQISEILTEAKPDIIKALQVEITRQVQWDVSREAAGLVKDEVVRFVQAEIIPEIQKQLVASKEGLISLAVPL